MPTSYPIFKDSVRNWILNNIDLDTYILDVGPGVGTYSDLLRGYGYKMDAIEVWEPYVDKYDLRSKYDKVIVDNIMDRPIGFFDKYGFVILGDVLEHLTAQKGRWLMDYLNEKEINFLVAVPYTMEQGEHEGNIYETHLQPDLTPEVMGSRYPEMQLLYGNNFYGYYIRKGTRSEKAYVLYADESYFDLALICRESILKHSKYPVYIYTLDFDTDYDFCIYWECDIKPLKKRKEFIDREDTNIYKILIERPKIVKHALGKFADQIAYVDTDSIATFNVDRIFDCFNADSTYPYFTEGIYDYLHVNGRGGAETREDMSTTLEAPACDLFLINQYVRQRYRQTGYFVTGMNCIDWLDEWAWMCQHPFIMRNNAWYAPFHEETIANCLLWKYNQHKGLPYCYINGLHESLEYKDHEYILKNWQKVPLKDNHFFYHGEKDTNKLKQFINENTVSSTTP